MSLPVRDRYRHIFNATGSFMLLALFCVGCLAFLPSSPAQAALAGVVWGTGVWHFWISRRQLDGITIIRSHRARIFQNDAVWVTLRVGRGDGFPIEMMELEDRFMASLERRQSHLIPMLGHDWEVLLHYERSAERHRGRYLLGPVRLHVADPLGLFPRFREVDCITPLTVYPHAVALPNYHVPGPEAMSGPSLNEIDRSGQGEQILGVREYQRGDPVSRIHWRTSIRHHKLHVIEQDRPLQAELAVLVDLTRGSKYGLGAETTTERAIGAATSILRRGFETGHRLSLAYAQQTFVHYPAASGMDHLHWLLDRLAVVQPRGETDFWEAVQSVAISLASGSRAVFIVPAPRLQFESTYKLFTELIAAGVAVDLVLIDEQGFLKIYRDQEEDLRRPRRSFETLIQAFTLVGARVFPLTRVRPELEDLPHLITRPERETPGASPSPGLRST